MKSKLRSDLIEYKKKKLTWILILNPQKTEPFCKEDSTTGVVSLLLLFLSFSLSLSLSLFEYSECLHVLTLSSSPNFTLTFLLWKPSITFNLYSFTINHSSSFTFRVYSNTVFKK
ncbi:hypothetical protein EDC96DRAFT_298346 [Choanephora cucurbitarum]|nr:hypothetical protein EDC96DRAFT_298346 [Choanephora cucurbitarum]